jgi:hypothetical protein
MAHVDFGYGNRRLKFMHDYSKCKREYLNVHIDALSNHDDQITITSIIDLDSNDDYDYDCDCADYNTLKLKQMKQLELEQLEQLEQSESLEQWKLGQMEQMEQLEGEWEDCEDDDEEEDGEKEPKLTTSQFFLESLKTLKKKAK